MNNVIEVLNSLFFIKKIIINNFTLLDNSVSIEVEIETNDQRLINILFKEVKDINIDSNRYGCSVYSDIIIEDISQAQLEGVFYKISVLDDTMNFYCKEVELIEL